MADYAVNHPYNHDGRRSAIAQTECFSTLFRNPGFIRISK